MLESVRTVPRRASTPRTPLVEIHLPHASCASSWSRTCLRRSSQVTSLFLERSSGDATTTRASSTSVSTTRPGQTPGQHGIHRTYDSSPPSPTPPPPYPPP